MTEPAGPAGHQLAQCNVARLLAPIDGPQLAGFVAALAPVNALADAENITVTEPETEARISAILERSQPQERAALEKALKGGYRERIESEVRETKLFTWLIDNAKVKEVAEDKK